MVSEMAKVCLMKTRSIEIPQRNGVRCAGLEPRAMPCGGREGDDSATDAPATAPTLTTTSKLINATTRRVSLGLKGRREPWNEQGHAMNTPSEREQRWFSRPATTTPRANDHRQMSRGALLSPPEHARWILPSPLRVWILQSTARHRYGLVQSRPV